MKLAVTSLESTPIHLHLLSLLLLFLNNMDLFYLEMFQILCVDSQTAAILIGLMWACSRHVSCDSNTVFM